MTEPTAWLISEGRVMASAVVAESSTDRRVGLRGRGEHSGAFVLPSCRWIHTVGMRFDLDVAYLDSEGRVIKAVRMKRHRLGAPVLNARTVVEAHGGSFARWGLRVGDVIEIRVHNGATS